MQIRIYDAGRRTEPKSGYGLIATQMAANLAALGHEISFFPRGENETEDIALWIRPPHYADYPEMKLSKKNVFYTMHEETTFSGWKSNWTELLNRCDAIIVPTFWNQKTFKDLGVTIPIHVIPLGVNPKDFHGAKTYRFSILTLHDALGSDNSREDWKGTVNAYYKAFADTDLINDIQMTIKSYNIKRNEYYEFLREAQKPYKKVPPIDVVEIDMTPQSLNSLYSTHWLFLKNAKREGWSLPLLEAMATGINVAFTDIPVLEWAKEYRSCTVFAKGDTMALVKVLEHEHKQWQKKKGWINTLSWRKCAEKVEQVLKNV